MPTLKFWIKGVEFEFIGEEHEIVSFVNRFLGGSIVLPVHTKQVSPTPSPSVQERKESKEMIDLPIPSDTEVINYVESKPNFNHDLLEVQMHFFGRVFKSRGREQRMYHRTARQLRMIRQVIGQQYSGKFKTVKGDKRGLKRYVFQKSTEKILV